MDASSSGRSSLDTRRPRGADDQNLPLGLLPVGVEPLWYALALTVDPALSRFSGHIAITVAIQDDTSVVYLHGQSLAVTATLARLPDGRTIDGRYTQVHEDGVVRLLFEQPLPSGRAVIEIEYSTDFGRTLQGLYSVLDGGEQYAYTQLQPVYARQMFPSFDEPAFKTPFELSLIIDETHVAIANAPMIGETPIGSGKKLVRFAPTQPMPTYLVALAVGPFDVVDTHAIPPNAVRERPLPLRGVAVRGKGDQLTYALREAGPILDVLEAYFDRPYPYDKLDLIAVPDFEAGAMENTGAIMFRERFLLLSDDSPPQQRRAYAVVMAHELAHMWFGNLVTMPWWDDLWLNESFATWLSYKVVADYDAEQNPFRAKIRHTARAMKHDGLSNARRIREPVGSNDDIVAAFDSITYSKGGAVLNMFERYLGPELFRDGMRAHIQRFAHKSADVHDLFDSLSKANAADLWPAAESFLLQNGLPLVYAAIDCQQDKLMLAQSRYRPLGSSAEEARRWEIPICLKIEGATQPQCLLLKNAQATLPLDGTCPAWVLPNADFSGYYHWRIPIEQYDALFTAGSTLTEAEWLSITESIHAGLASGHLSVASTWSMIERLAASQYPSVSRSVLPLIRHIEHRLADTPKMRWTVRGRAADLYRSMNAYRAFDRGYLLALPNNEQRIHYSDIASFMAETAYDQPTRAAALKKAQAFLREDEAQSVSVATLDTILTVGVQDGGQGFVDALLTRFSQSSNAWFRDTALSALARSRDPATGDRLRAMALSGQLKGNEIRRLFVGQLQEDVNRPIVWEWLKDNIDTLMARMPAGHVPSLAQVADQLCEADYTNDIDQTLRPHLSQVPGGERRLDSALEAMAICIESVAAQRSELSFFDQGVRRS
ncbi:MAG: M1 family aminopeptidase [Pseudomonadota bacterium]